MIKPFLPKKSVQSFIILLITATFFIACKKNDIVTGSVTPPATPPDLTTTVTSSVSGFITDETNGPAKDVMVKVGTATITTDKYGFFEAKNVAVVKEAATVTVSKAGYFKNVKTYIAAQGKSAFLRIKLIPKTNVGTINSTAGGTVILPSGLSVTLPANSIVTAANNTAYTGDVTVTAYFINPLANDVNSIMPGDLRGLNTNGNIQLLTSYGMAAVELTGAGGELLQIAAGKRATLTMPIPAALQASTPAYIPLWYFDEAKGLWKQEGSATKTGNNYVGEVSHFSFWNCDVPNNYVEFNCTVVNNNNQPLKNALVKISAVNITGIAAYGYTDSAGYVSGAVPANANLLLEVLSNCNNPVHSQTFITTTANVSLGAIAVTNNTYLANITGTANTCANSPIANGNILLQIGQQYYSYAISNGIFNFTTVLCSTPNSVSVIVEDIINLQQSTPAYFTINAGNNNIPTIQACATSTFQYVDYTLDTTLHHYSNPADSISSGSSSTYSILTFFSPANSINFGRLSFSGTNIGVGNTQILDTITGPGFPFAYTRPAPIKVNITEYGAVGQFVSGNFNGTIIGPAPFNRVYSLSCSFRYKR
jgi:hypothetical protein